jgi:hypothetical protein
VPSFLRFAKANGEIASTNLVGVVSRFCDRAAYRSDQVVKGILRSAVERLNTETPVLTGASVGNWRVSVNRSDDTFYPDRLDKGRTLALGLNLAVIETVKAGQRVYVTNPTPWLLYWEYGTARMAPRPIVRSLQADLPAIARRHILEWRKAEAPEGYFEGVWRTIFGR